MNSICDLAYDGTIEGYLSVVDYCITAKIMPRSIKTDYVVSHLANNSKYQLISTNYSRANRIYRIVGKRSSAEVQQMVLDCFLTCIPNMEMDLFIMICKAIKYGSIIAEDYKDELMHRIQFAIRDLYREAQSVINSICFKQIDGVLYSTISPRNNVMALIEKNICNMADNNILIFDKRHNIALVRSAENSNIFDVKRVLNCEIRTIDDLRNHVWTYLCVNDSIQMRDLQRRDADSLTRLWHIAS